MEGPRPDKFAFAQRSGAMKAPVGLLSDRTVLPQARWKGPHPDKFAFVERSGTMKAPVGLLSDRTVLRQQDGGASPRQVPVCRTSLNSGKAPAFQKRMQGLFCLLQDNFAVFTGIHHKGAAGCQRAVDQALGGGVFHGFANDAAQIARTKLATLTLLHQRLECCRGVAVGDARM